MITVMRIQTSTCTRSLLYETATAYYWVSVVTRERCDAQRCAHAEFPLT